MFIVQRAAEWLAWPSKAENPPGKINLPKILSWSVWLPFLYFGAATVVMTWPLVRDLDQSVIGQDGGDNWYYVWLIGWFQKSIFELFQNPLFVPLHNYPYGWHLAYSEITPANVLIALPFSLFAGPVFAYNVVILLSFLLSGWVVYHWVLTSTHYRPAGLIAGTLFAFAPFRLAHVYGHLPLMGTQYIALHYFGLIPLLGKQRFAWKVALVSGLGLGLTALSSMYYLYMTLVVSTILIIGHIAVVDHEAPWRKSFWQNLLSLVLISLPFLIIAVAPYLQLSWLGEANHRSFEEVDFWSASISDFFIPAPTHFIWGNWVAEKFNPSMWIERNLYLGSLAILLSGMAIAFDKKSSIGRRPVLLLFLGAATAVVLSMGTTLHWMGDQVLLELPPFLRPWFSSDSIYFRLPQDFLFKFLPYYDGMRTWTRYGVFASLFIAVLAGIGFANLSRLVRPRFVVQLVLPLILIGVGIEYFVGPYPLSEVKPREVDYWLSAQATNGAVIEFPIQRSTQPKIIYGTLLHNKPLLGMFYGAYLPERFRRSLPKLIAFPDERSLKFVKKSGVEYLVVDSAAYSNWSETQAKIKSLGLYEVAKLEEQYVYRLP